MSQASWTDLDVHLGRKATPDVGRAEQRAKKGGTSIAPGLGSLDWAPERQAFGGRQCPAEEATALLFHQELSSFIKLLAVGRQGSALLLETV